MPNNWQNVWLRTCGVAPVICVFVIHLTLALTVSALAAAPQGAGALPDTPAKVAAHTTSVSVVHEGKDSIGARLATRLKELCNASNLFRLENGNEPKIQIQVYTQAEFPGRPGVGSVYTVIWAFSQNQKNLAYLLAHELGVLTADEVDDVAYKIVERTDGISVKYAYLFGN